MARIHSNSDKCDRSFHAAYPIDNFFIIDYTYGTPEKSWNNVFKTFGGIEVINDVINSEKRGLTGELMCEFES